MICSDCQKEADVVVWDAGVSRCCECYQTSKEIESRNNSFKELGKETNSKRSSV